MEMFEYAFMQRAFIVGVLLALIIPLIGVTVVLRRLSMLAAPRGQAARAAL